MPGRPVLRFSAERHRGPQQAAPIGGYLSAWAGQSGLLNGCDVAGEPWASRRAKAPRVSRLVSSLASDCVLPSRLRYGRRRAGSAQCTPGERWCTPAARTGNTAVARVGGPGESAGISRSVAGPGVVRAPGRDGPGRRGDERGWRRGRCPVHGGAPAGSWSAGPGAAGPGGQRRGRTAGGWRGRAGWQSPVRGWSGPPSWGAVVAAGGAGGSGGGGGVRAGVTAARGPGTGR